MGNDAWSQTVQVKATICANLDRASRKYNHHLKHFVMWSSVSALYGNPGQTNYGYANASMEGVCMKRKYDGYCGVAIQWGIIGNVGVLNRAHTDIQMEDDASAITNTSTNTIMKKKKKTSANKGLNFLPQHIDSCLDISLNHILSYNDANSNDIDKDNDICGMSGVVTSYIRDREEEDNSTTVPVSSTPVSASAKLARRIAKALGEDATKIKETDTLSSLGMDSLQSVEITNILKTVASAGNTTNSKGNQSKPIVRINELRYLPWKQLCSFGTDSSTISNDGNNC